MTQGISPLVRLRASGTPSFIAKPERFERPLDINPKEQAL